MRPDLFVVLTASVILLEPNVLKAHAAAMDSQPTATVPEKFKDAVSDVKVELLDKGKAMEEFSYRKEKIEALFAKEPGTRLVLVTCRLGARLLTNPQGALLQALFPGGKTVPALANAQSMQLEMSRVVGAPMTQILFAVPQNAKRFEMLVDEANVISVSLPSSDPSAPRYPVAEINARLLQQAKKLLSEGDFPGALQNAADLQATKGDDPGAKSIIEEIASKRLVILSKPTGLPVFLAPAAAINDGTKADDTRTPLAEKYKAQGIPRAVGCEDFAVGKTPLVMARPAPGMVICVVRQAEEGRPIEGTRSLVGRQARAAYGNVDMVLGPTGGFRPRTGAFVVWDDGTQKSGQVQILQDGRLSAIVMFLAIPPENKPLIMSLEPGDLYEPISKREINIGR